MFTLVKVRDVRLHLRPSVDPPDVAGAIDAALHTGVLSANLGLSITRTMTLRALAKKKRPKRRKLKRKATSLLSKYRSALTSEPTASVRKIAGRLVKRGRDYTDNAGRQVAINRTAKQIHRALEKTGR